MSEPTLKQLLAERRNSSDYVSLVEFLCWRDELERLGLWDKMIEDAAATRERSRSLAGGCSED